jgi:hypothetical protein
MSFTDYLGAMRNSGTYGTAAELTALANVLRRRIMVIATIPNAYPTEPIKPQATGARQHANKVAPLVLGYYPDHGGHFIPCGKPDEVNWYTTTHRGPPPSLPGSATPHEEHDENAHSEPTPPNDG